MEPVSNLTLEEIDQRIARTAVEAAIEIGYYLKQIRDRELYKEAGCRDVYEYAQKQYGYDRSTTSRNMSRNDRFSVGGNSPELAEKYLGYGKSQLQEMISMTDEQLGQVKPDMTVREMKNLKKKPEKTGESGSCATSQPRELIKPNEELRKRLNDFAKYFICCNHNWMLEDYHNRVLDVTKSPEEIKKLIRNDPSHWSFMSFRSDGCLFHINLFDEYVQLWDGEKNCCLGDFEWFYPAAAIQRMWNEVALEKAQGKLELAKEPELEPVATSQQQEEEPESNIIDGECREVEVLPEEELYEETSDRTDKELAQEEVEKANKILNLMLEEFTGNDVRVRKQKVLVAALAGYICDLENLEIPELEQPELPIFRNNDQRKEWLRSYKDWGLWYEDTNIGVKYYKYDFDNGARLIVEVYEEPKSERWHAGYERSHFHLVGGPKSKHNKWSWHERYSKYPNSETELVEFLKEVQRSGQTDRERSNR